MIAENPSFAAVGVAGQMQNGKDTIADFLYSAILSRRPIQSKINPSSIFNFSYRRDAFAAGVKKVFCDTFGVDMDFIEKWKTIPEPPPGFLKPVRQSLQFIGDGFREIQGDVWLKKPFLNKNSNPIISDARYINELDKIFTVNGTNILAWHPDRENDDPNGSEKQIKPVVDFWKQTEIEGDTSDFLLNLDPSELSSLPEGTDLIHLFIRNDGTVQDLHKKVERIVLPYLENRYKVAT